MALHHLILWRHGETDWNAEFRMQGHRDVPCNENGLAQARAAAPSVAAMDPQVIRCSDLQRARQTAAALTTRLPLPVQVDPRLRETNLGQWEGLTREDLLRSWPTEWQRWRTTTAHGTPPDGESRWQVAQRARAVVDDLDGTGAERALLVTHGGLIVGLTGLLLDLPDASWTALAGVGNCHWVVLHRADGRWRLHSYNAGVSDLVVASDEPDDIAGS